MKRPAFSVGIALALVALVVVIVLAVIGQLPLVLALLIGLLAVARIVP